MILPFSQQINGNNTYFAEKIIRALDFFGKNHDVEFYTNLFNKEPVFTSHLSLHFKNEKLGFNVVNPKLHTIRKDEKNRWKAGNKIHAVYNNRQKNQFQFAPTFECKRAEKDSFEIIYKGGVAILKVENKPDFQEVEKFAINDGFDSINDFFNYFNTDFTGKIIHFTNLKY